MSLKIIYAREPLPSGLRPEGTGLFLAGPTPRSDQVRSWRPEAMQILERLGFAGVVLAPEDRDGHARFDYDEQVEWEWDALEAAAAIAFWVPRDLVTLPAFTTNVEFGFWVRSGKVVLGAPNSAPKMSYLRRLAKRFDVPCFEELEPTLKRAMTLIRHDGRL